MVRNKRGFASDNNAGIHPVILNEISSVNNGHVIGYGADKYTEEAIGVFKSQFGVRLRYSSFLQELQPMFLVYQLLYDHGILSLLHPRPILKLMSAVLLRSFWDVRY
jgi:hypothetical protein